jgi:hypothetical protein
MTGRPLTACEWTQLSPGLALVLRNAGVEPLIVARAHPAAWIAALWRGSLPVIALGRRIWWPEAKADLSDETEMPVLQHELQHVLDYAQGRLSAVGYLLQPRHWTYRYDLLELLSWGELGAEQRASLAEDYWIAQHRGDAQAAQAMGRIIPWARKRCLNDAVFNSVSTAFGGVNAGRGQPHQVQSTSNPSHWVQE